MTKRNSFWNTPARLGCVITGLALIAGCTPEPAKLGSIEAQLTTISRQLESLKVEESSGARFANSSDPEFARTLAAATTADQADMIRQKLSKAQKHEALTVETVTIVTHNMLSLDTFIDFSSQHDPKLVEEVTQEHQRLLKLLEDELPKLIVEIGDEARQENDYLKAQKLWNTGNAILDYIPSTEDPIKEADYHELARLHEQIGSEIEAAQHQRYNRWATTQLRQATQRTSSALNDVERQEVCLQLVGPIDPSLLEPVTLNLYSTFLDQLEKEVSIEAYYAIAEGLTEAERSTLFDIP